MNRSQIIDLIRQTAMRYGVDPDAAVRVADIETGGSFSPTAQNPHSSAGGVFQFIDSTWRQYGGGADKYDPVANVDAGIRFMRDNAQTLANAGINPDPGSLYLAHQQGAGGAIRLLSNPDARAVDTVGRDAVRLNAGHPDMTNAEFAAKWMNRASGKKTTEPGAFAGDPQAAAVTPKEDQAGANTLMSLFDRLMEEEAEEERRAEQQRQEQTAMAMQKLARREEERRRQERRNRQGIGALREHAGIAPSQDRFGYGGVRNATKGLI